MYSHLHKPVSDSQKILQLEQAFPGRSMILQFCPLFHCLLTHRLQYWNNLRFFYYASYSFGKRIQTALESSGVIFRGLFQTYDKNTPIPIKTQQMTNIENKKASSFVEAFKKMKIFLVIPVKLVTVILYTTRAHEYLLYPVYHKIRLADKLILFRRVVC